MSPDHLEMLQFAAFGGLGGLLGSACKTRTLQLPRILRRGVNPEERVVLLDLGFLAAPLLGGILAAVIDGRPSTAIAYGLASGWVGPAVVNAVLDPFLAKIGMGPISREIPDAGEKTCEAGMEKR